MMQSIDSTGPAKSKPRPPSTLEKNLTVLLLLLLFLAIPTTTLLPQASAEENKQNILILNSYHIGYKWSDEILRGIMDVLQPTPPSMAIYLEYMDMKRHYSEERFALLFHSLAEKYQDIEIDYVLASDDSAFLFLREYVKDLFPAATVVFCGTNYLQEEDLSGLVDFYGINEEADIGATFDLMLSIHPDTQRIFIINDQTTTGKKMAPSIVEAARRYQPQITFSYADNISMTRLLQTVANLPPQSLIFYTFFFRDSNGNIFDYDESISMIAQASPVPIYGSWSFNLGLGIIGGMLTSGYHQGEAAAKLLMYFLQGHSPPPAQLSQSPNTFMFDYTYLQKFAIPVDKLPDEAIIINKPESFVERHRQVLLFSAIFITLLFFIILALIINILMRKKAEKKLQQSERNFRGIFENAIEGLFQASLHGNFLKVNHALAKILKCDSPEDVLSSYDNLKNDLFVKPELHNHLINQVLENGSAQLEEDLLCKDGSIITALLYCRNVVDEKGRNLYLEGSITDMTEYKMTQEIIIQTEKMLTLGGLSAGIAHEIKNPLTSMMQAATLISNRLLHHSPQNQESAEEAGISFEALHRYLEIRGIPHMLGNMAASGKRANIIVEDMLSFSKKTIGEFAFESFEDIVREAVELAKKDYSLDRDYSFKKIRINYDFADDVPLLYCSKSKILQVLFNILKNSAEAMADAKTINPEITCTIRFDNDSIKLEIKDNGPGMDHKVKEKIFEPFYSTKSKKKGTGLGLSIADYIVSENHKGKLSVESAPEEGANFILKFPRHGKMAQQKAAQMK
ncbi:PAS domain-containing sensor histidine kinase [Desulfopila inferna]|uniref:PAS domain-containing sensor histidine kinase n=1 Tax=Desulfopila inferna TaxID=468528 RepID=UPI001964A2AC|nr:PAS domain-containing sensor histidine kinase [Desulfopila inferna]MBM9605895.1 PAS domain-containing sensor histidine kinase [Desulfopila inferna]